MSRDGKTIYASIRGTQNLIAVLSVSGESLSLTHHFSTHGSHPRDILPICDDRFLLVANRDSDNLVLFDCKHNDQHINQIDIPEGVAIVTKGC